MKKTKKLRNSFTVLDVIIISVVFAIISSIISVCLFSHDNNEEDIMKTYNKIMNNYYGDVDGAELTDAAIKGMMDFLGEKYTMYLDKNDSSLLSSELDGKYRGIGITVQRTVNNDIVIVNVSDNTPAAKAGLKENDILKKFDEIDLTNYDLNKINDLIKEKDEVKVTIARDGNEKVVNVKLSNLDVPVVYSEIFNRNNKKIGRLYLTSFASDSYNQFKSELEKIEQENIDSLIIDVRSNSGGYLTSAEDILELFLNKGKVMYQLDTKDGKSIVKAKTKSSRNYDIVVLIDANTASASEMLATSLKESYGAIIVGTTSYGKGRVQQLSNLSDNTFIKYTTANWYTPNGNSIDEVGITPGVYVELTIDYLLNPCNDTDAQLQKAIEILAK